MSSYFDNFFENDNSTETDEIGKSQLSTPNNGHISEKLKTKPKFQSSNAFFSAGSSIKNNYKSKENLEETHKTFTEAEWRKILLVNDIEHTPYLELLGSLRAGIPDNL